MKLTILDLVVAFVAVLAAVRGWRRGVLGQAFELGGGFVGLLLGVALGPRVASAVTNRPGIEGALLSLAVVFVGLSIGQAIGFVLGHRFGTAVRRARLGALDSGLGAVFGAAITLLTYWLIGSLLVTGPVAPVARQLRRSQLLKVMNDVSAPPDVLAYIRQYLQTNNFPQVFAGIPPDAGPPVRLPSNKLAARAVRAAKDSTVRVVAPACGGTQVGTGWIAGDSTVVTNAHVVAGGDGVSIIEPTNDDDAASVVVFDPRTDVAVLRVEDLDGPSLRLAGRSFERGQPGATLGFPGEAGGRMRTHRAAVQANFTATGLDIYGRQEVSRDVYELQARVRQGDSGGPFVLPDGRVAGVVFAASTTGDSTGYALTAPEVADDVARGLRATTPVSTGGCTH